MNREDVYKLIDGERTYQNITWDGISKLTIGETVLLLESYTEHARKMWTTEKPPEHNTLEMIRKIAAIATRCMENYETRPRDLTPYVQPT